MSGSEDVKSEEGQDVKREEGQDALLLTMMELMKSMNRDAADSRALMSSMQMTQGRLLASTGDDDRSRVDGATGPSATGRRSGTSVKLEIFSGTKATMSFDDWQADVRLCMMAANIKAEDQGMVALASGVDKDIRQKIMASGVSLSHWKDGTMVSLDWRR